VAAEAIARGSRAFLTITAGLGQDETELSRLLHESGARMIGPNSLGMYDAAANLQLAWGNFTPGPLAIVSQSGQLGSEIAILAARAGIGVSRFYSVGNQLDVDAADLLESLVEDEHTTTVALYLESFTNGARTVSAMRELRRAGKHVLVLTTGASEGSQRLARSHTGSMTSALDVVDAACRAGGAQRVPTPGELVELARLLANTTLPHGRRVAIVSDSGGQGGIAADVAAAHGLNTPSFSAELQDRLRTLLPAGAAVANPVDLAGAGEADLDVYADLTELLAASGEVDAVLLSGYLGRYGEDTPEILETELAVVDRLGEQASRAHVPLVVHSMSAESAAVARMWEHHLPAFGTVDAAIGALARAAAMHEHRGRPTGPHGVDSAAPRTGYWAARTFLASRGIRVPRAVLVYDPAEAAERSADLLAPLVLKAGWLEHKSEHGGIRVGLTSAGVVEAFEEMHARLGPGEYVIEEQDTRPDVVELLIGARWDRDFGPTIAVGYGGVEAELWRDVCVELAPVDRGTATAMIDSLRSRPLLDGWRGRAAADTDALADLVVSVSEAIAAQSGISEIEINPVRLAADGALAVDALIVPVAPNAHPPATPA